MLIDHLDYLIFFSSLSLSLISLLRLHLSILLLATYVLRYVIWRSSAWTLFVSTPSSGLPNGSNLNICDNSKVMAPIKIASNHCCGVRPWYLYSLKNTFKKCVIIHCSTKIMTTITQYSTLEQGLLRIFGSSLILLQLKKLNICIITNVVKMNVKCLECTLYLL